MRLLDELPGLDPEWRNTLRQIVQLQVHAVPAVQDRLRRPVFIDVIVLNYEHSPGEPSLRQVGDVDIGVFRAAVLAGSNEGYGETVSDRAERLAPGA